MANDIPELKPCPFCGSSDIRDASYSIASPVEYFGQFSCANCDVEGPTSEFKYDNRNEAIVDAASIWNTRTAPKVKPLAWRSEGFGYWTSVGASGQYQITINESNTEFFASGPGVRSFGTDLDGEKAKCDAANAEELATFFE